MAELLHRQETIHHLKPDPDHLAQLSERVQEVRQQILAQMEDHYAGHDQELAVPDDGSHVAAQFLSAGACCGRGGNRASESRAEFRIDLAGLKRVAQMGSWQPQYVDLDPSQERLAETVLKLEREVYGIKRPHQLANRDVFLRIGDPIDLGQLRPVLSPGCPGGTPRCRRTTPRRDPGPHRRHQESTGLSRIRRRRRATFTTV